MITLIVLFLLFLFGAFIVALITGIISVAPGLVIVLALPALDFVMLWLLIKLIKRKRGK